MLICLNLDVERKISLLKCLAQSDWLTVQGARDKREFKNAHQYCNSGEQHFTPDLWVGAVRKERGKGVCFWRYLFLIIAGSEAANIFHSFQVSKSDTSVRRLTMKLRSRNLRSIVFHLKMNEHIYIETHLFGDYRKERKTGRTFWLIQDWRAGLAILSTCVLDKGTDPEKKRHRIKLWLKQIEFTEEKK